MGFDIFPREFPKTSPRRPSRPRRPEKYRYSYRVSQIGTPRPERPLLHQVGGPGQIDVKRSSDLLHQPLFRR